MYIPRNHLVEEALKNAINGNNKEFDKLWKREQKIKTFHKISTESQYMKIYDKFWRNETKNDQLPY